MNAKKKAKKRKLAKKRREKRESREIRLKKELKSEIMSSIQHRFYKKMIKSDLAYTRVDKTQYKLINGVLGIGKMIPNAKHGNKQTRFNKVKTHDKKGYRSKLNRSSFQYFCKENRIEPPKEVGYRV